MFAGKVWGNTELIHANGVLEFHRINIKQGGTCSKHKHNFKIITNVFMRKHFLIF